MRFQPKLEKKLNGNYIFGFETKARVNTCLHEVIFQEIWHGFCCQAGEILLTPVSEMVLKIGEAKELETPASGYVMEITETGISIVASDTRNLIYGFFSLLERIHPISTDEGKELFSVACCHAQDEGCIKERMVHFCIFPETKLHFIQKFLRTAAFLRYTHVIVEFWGMLQYDCLKELAWKNAFTKEQLRPLFAEAKTMGLEIVPMFNHWGHASSCRVSLGKHVTLDQNLRLAPLFDVSGWNWNLENPTVQNLHAKIRDELMELCGDGEYFHIGCDEPYGLFSKEYYEFVVAYINDVEKDLRTKGRKTVMWGDMLLHDSILEKKTKNAYTTCSPSEEVQQVLVKNLSRNIVIADWEYSATEYPVETCEYLVKQGFEILLCPWNRSPENAVATVKTVKAYKLKGHMHTTWHTAEDGMGFMGFVAGLTWHKETEIPQQWCYEYAYTATVMRKLWFPNGDYEKSGWTEQQVRQNIQ